MDPLDSTSRIAALDLRPQSIFGQVVRDPSRMRVALDGLRHRAIKRFPCAHSACLSTPYDATDLGIAAAVSAHLRDPILQVVAVRDPRDPA